MTRWQAFRLEYKLSSFNHGPVISVWRGLRKAMKAKNENE